jgi:diketogulonate reductase-like aldo/keto reductase
MLTRRQFCGLLAGCAAWPALGQASPEIHKRAIPSTGERLPVIGMGSYVTFDIGDSETQLAQRARVLEAFFASGGTLIDSSPMYDTSEAALGKALGQLGHPSALFSATKVWHWFTGAGDRQMMESRALWGETGFDLMQVHNLVNWHDHLQTIRRDRDAGLVRYVGITTSHGRLHDEMLDVMRREPLDFVQFTYNILDREAEQRLLPTAADKGLAVIINRPFRRKGLIRRFRRHPLPPWAGEIGCDTWAQFLLKFIAAHPAVTCVIPATSRVDHMVENMAVLSGPLPDPSMRRAMIDYVERL